jgi:hypothetical protein
LKLILGGDGNISFKQIKPSHIRAKVDYINLSPFNKTLYLDSDTLPLFNLSDVFDALDYVDLCICHDFSRKRENIARGIQPYGDIPRSLPEVNGGVFAYKATDEVSSFFKVWREYFYKYFVETNGWDQPSLRAALYESKVRFSIMPDEYNTRTEKILKKNIEAKDIVGKDYLKSKILHLHIDEKVVSSFIESKDIELLKEVLRNTDFVWPLGVKNDINL